MFDAASNLFPQAMIPPALFGLTWSMLFWGAALGSIPIIIHLLHKRKYRETPWAAMRFLLEAARKHSRRIRLEQLLLLLIRTMILLFLVAGLQGMYTTSTASQTAASGPTHHILVLDASFSMQYEPSRDCPIFVRAKQAALSVIDSANDGDVFQLVLITGTGERGVVKRATRSKSDFRNVLGVTDGKRPCDDLKSTGLTAGDELARLTDSLRDVREMLDDVENVPSKRVYVVSDFQKTTWRPDAPPQRERIREEFQSIGERASLVLIDVGDESAENAAVIDFNTDQPFVVAGRPLQLKATLHNFGSNRAANRTVELFVDGVKRDEQTVTLEPNAGRQVEFEYPPRAAVEAGGDAARASAPQLSPGEHLFEVRLHEDGLNVDNVRRLALPVKARLNVLLVNGRPAGRPADEATYYVQKALQPSKVGEEWQGIIQPRVVPPGDLPSSDLSDVDCVYLCDVPTLKANEARKLESYVDAGGGLVICLGEQVDLPTYNERLYRDGVGVMPARLLANVGSEYAVDRVYRLDTSQMNHPIVEPFLGNPGTGLEDVLAFRYARTELSADGGGRVVLRYQRVQAGRRGDPAIIAARVGLGNVVLITTSLDARWSTWVANPSFPALMNEIVHHCVAGSWRDRQRQVGEAIARGFAATAASEAASTPIVLPDGSTQNVSLSGRDRWVVRSGGADFFNERPEDPNAVPAGRIPVGRVVLRRGRTGDYLSVLHEQRPVWVKQSSLRRISAAMLYFDETTRSGVYEIQLRPPLGRNELYAVNVDPAESDLARVDEKTLRNDVLAKVPFLYRTGWQGEIRTEQIAASRQNPLTRWFLVAVLCLLAVELVTAWRFSAGMLLLGLIVAFEGARLASTGGTAVGLAAGASLFGAVALAAFLVRHRQRGALPPPQRSSMK